MTPVDGRRTCPGKAAQRKCQFCRAVGGQGVVCQVHGGLCEYDNISGRGMTWVKTIR